MFAAAPDLAYEKRVTVPLRAGDCTFHNGYLAHTANPNDTDEFRYAMVNIYIDAETRFSGAGHVCTDDLGLTAGEVLPDEEFPRFVVTRCSAAQPIDAAFRCVDARTEKRVRALLSQKEPGASLTALRGNLVLSP